MSATHLCIELILSSADITPPPPPGWYTNPTGPGQRYWDGQKWTDSYSQPTPVDTRVENAASGTPGLVIVGYILAVVIPIVGFILGIVAVTRPDKRMSKHGVWIIVLSVVAFLIYIILIAHANAGSGTESTS
jgi:ABC-type dipeptide/oligopeptide/nickel transport system permease component